MLLLSACVLVLYCFTEFCGFSKNLPHNISVFHIGKTIWDFGMVKKRLDVGSILSFFCPIFVCNLLHTASPKGHFSTDFNRFQPKTKKAPYPHKLRI